MIHLTKLQNHTRHTLNFWKSGAKGWAPQKASEKLEIARIDWLLSLSDTLTIWCKKNNKMTDGELILAYANLGALVEGWLKLFYCICISPILQNQEQTITDR